MIEHRVILRLRFRDNTTMFWPCQVFTDADPKVCAQIHLALILAGIEQEEKL